MNFQSRLTAWALATGLLVGAGSISSAQQASDPKAKGLPEVKLPPGWTMEDMQACILASTPGKMHQHLTEGVGTWTGKQTMWMAPDTEPVKSETISTCSPMMDGRFVKVEFKGEIPGMGPYSGFGLYGYDNVSKQFVSTWLDNQSTGMMVGAGKLSDDGKTLTMTYTHNCPITKKPTVMRDIETIKDANHKTLEMYGTDPKSGKEYKMMVIELTRK